MGYGLTDGRNKVKALGRGVFIYCLHVKINHFTDHYPGMDIPSQAGKLTGSGTILRCVETFSGSQTWGPGSGSYEKQW